MLESPTSDGSSKIQQIQKLSRIQVVGSLALFKVVEMNSDSIDRIIGILRTQKIAEQFLILGNSSSVDDEILLKDMMGVDELPNNVMEWLEVPEGVTLQNIGSAIAVSFE